MIQDILPIIPVLVTCLGGLIGYHLESTGKITSPAYFYVLGYVFALISAIVFITIFNKPPAMHIHDYLANTDSIIACDTPIVGVQQLVITQLAGEKPFRYSVNCY